MAAAAMTEDAQRLSLKTVSELATNPEVEDSVDVRPPRSPRSVHRSSARA